MHSDSYFRANNLKLTINELYSRGNLMVALAFNFGGYFVETPSKMVLSQIHRCQRYKSSGKRFEMNVNSVVWKGPHDDRNNSVEFYCGCTDLDASLAQRNLNTRNLNGL